MGYKRTKRKMKKILLMLFIIITTCVTPSTASNSMSNSTSSTSMSSSDDSKEFIDSVEAQDMYGRNTKILLIYGRRLSNGKYRFFAMTRNDSTREFTIQYANNNRYKPFYIKIGDERWYFSSQTLDLYSGKTDQW